MCIPKNVTRIVTHSGAFHADDLFAYVVLRQLYPEASLVRSRDPEVLADHREQSIIFDVGGEYDPGAGGFDHHQRGRPLRDDGLPYSSFGLIWRHFGFSYLDTLLGPSVDFETIEEIHAQIDEQLVRLIDAHDNGQDTRGVRAVRGTLSLTGLLALHHPDFDASTPEALDAAFLTASEMAKMTLENLVRRAGANKRSERIVAQAIAERTNPAVIELPCGMEFTTEVLRHEDAGDVLFAVFPDNGQWLAATVSTRSGGFTSRKLFPEAWAGLRGEELAHACGIAEAEFCHLERFVLGAATREAVLALIEKAIAA